jgi:hypothetical protein
MCIENWHLYEEEVGGVKRRVNLSFDDGVYRRFQAKCKAKGLPCSYVVSSLIRIWMGESCVIEDLERVGRVLKEFREK